MKHFLARQRFKRSLLEVQPRASIDTYTALYNEVRNQANPAVDNFVRRSGFDMPKDFLDNLALHTQVVIKESPLNYQHGRVLYSVLRRYAEDVPASEELRILETGTARGFSAVCMSRALRDAGAAGCVITIDRLPHDEAILWNCIDDHEGAKTRAELLSPWSLERDRCLFLSGESKAVLESLGLSRIHFAFLDGEHSEEAVLREFAFVQDRQQPGDMVVFDDVTPLQFPGIDAAVRSIEREGRYQVTRISSSDQRGYAIARRAGP